MGMLRKALIVLRALEAGMEVDINGVPHVWLDSKVVGSTDTHDYIIDGLSMKFKRIKNLNTNEQEPFYAGTNIDVTAFVNMCNNMPDEKIDELHTELLKRGK